MVQWLGPHAFTAVAWVRSLVRELRSHRPRGAAKKKKGEEETFILVFIAKEPGARNMPSADPWWGGDGGDDNDS